MTILGLIRHGTTEWNLAGRMQGQMDTPLAEVGRKQAELLAARLAGGDETWDGLLSSDLIRARETAEIISHHAGIPLLGTDSRLRERAFGQLEGTTLNERVSRWGENWRALDLGMESDEALLARWQAFLLETEQRYSGQRLLVVTHGGYIVPVLTHFWGQSVEEHLHNTSLTVMQKLELGWQCNLLNCTLHLKALG